MLSSSILVLSFFFKARDTGPAQHRSRCTGGVVGYTGSLRCLAVVIVPRCRSQMDSNSANILKNRSQRFLYLSDKLNLVASVWFESFVAFVTDGSVQCRLCHTDSVGFVVYRRYCIERIDVFRSVAAL